MSTSDGLPWVCAEHPEAQIRHTWDRTRTEVNLRPNCPRQTIGEYDHNHLYECAVCGRELAPPKEVPHDD